MAAAIALLLTILLNAGIVGTPHLYEDDPIVALMGDVAIDAVREAHPTECPVEADPTWSFTRDSAGATNIVGITGTCEYAGWFYRSPETHKWVFEVAGS